VNQAALRLAVSKGRILEETLPLLARAGIVPVEDPARSRKLIIEASGGMQLVVIRAADVPTFVQYGAADLGIAGKDVLLEHGGEGLYEPLDLGIARCRLMVAGLPGAGQGSARLRVATKYVRVTQAHYASQGRQVETIKLYGSMELAPIAGLADLIVDLVDTGSTLKANGLVEFEKIADISSRLVVNPAALRLKSTPVKALIAALRAAVEGR
jgi:ATP phosphoribosyltransferase